MKKEDLQNSIEGTDSVKKIGESNTEQKKRTTSISNNQQNNFTRQAGLGRDRMTEIEDLGEVSGRDGYTGSEKDDLSNQNLNASNDQ